MRFIFFFVCLPLIAGPPNPDRNAIAEFLANYAKVPSNKRQNFLDRVTTHYPLVRNDVTLAEMKECVALLESRVGKATTQDLILSRKTFLNLRIDYLRAMVSVSDRLIGKSGTDLRLMEGISFFMEGADADVKHIVTHRFDSKSLPAVFNRYRGGSEFRAFHRDLVAAAHEAQDLIPGKKLTTILEKYVPNYLEIQRNGFEAWGTSSRFNCKKVVSRTRFVD